MWVHFLKLLEHRDGFFCHMLLAGVPPQCVSLCRSSEMIFHGHPWLPKVVRPGSPLNEEPRPNLLYIFLCILHTQWFFIPGEMGGRDWRKLTIAPPLKQIPVVSFSCVIVWERNISVKHIAWPINYQSYRQPSPQGTGWELKHWMYWSLSILNFPTPLRSCWSWSVNSLLYLKISHSVQVS